jgi:hypothetical protein
MPKPKVIYDLRGGDGPFDAHVECPGCGLVLGIDAEQYAGQVSMDCPDCDYHETHSFLDDEELPF